MRILLFEGISLFSRGIRMQTRCKYSHAAIELSDLQVVEALFWDGVVLAPSYETHHTSGTWVDVYTVNNPDFDHHKAEEFARQSIGMPYDKMSILRFLSHTPARQNGMYFCSEHVLETCVKGGERLQRGDTAQMPPRDIYRSMGLTHIDRKQVL